MRSGPQRLHGRGFHKVYATDIKTVGMSFQSPLRTYSLLLVLGLALVWVAFSAGGETDTVYQYTAYEVEHADGELTATNVHTGRTREGIRVEHMNIDERIVCLPSHTRQCSLERQALDGNVSAKGTGSDYRYVYLDGEFHRITSESMGEFRHERTDATEAFAELSVDSDRLRPAERATIETGRTITTRAFANTNRLVEHDGAYYTLLATAQKSYGSGGSFCSSSGDGFCRDASVLRWKSRLYPVGVGILGALGIVVGGLGLLGAWREN